MIRFPDSDLLAKLAGRLGLPVAVIVRDLARYVEILNLRDKDFFDPKHSVLGGGMAMRTYGSQRVTVYDADLTTTTITSRDHLRDLLAYEDRDIEIFPAPLVPTADSGKVWKSDPVRFEPYALTLPLADSRPPSERELHDAYLTALIRKIHAGSGGTYGSPSVHAELDDEHGIGVGEKRVVRMMRKAGLKGARGRRRRPGTTLRVAGVLPAEDLVDRDFTATAPNQLWVADMKEVETDEGKLYLAAVTDCFSRKVVGWSMAGHMRAEVVVATLEMALARRRPGEGLIHHSDHGS